jgi:hypothetical protein
MCGRPAPRRSDVAVRDAPPAAMMGLMESAHGLG